MLEYFLLVNIQFIRKGISLTKKQTLSLQQHNSAKQSEYSVLKYQPITKNIISWALWLWQLRISTIN